MVVFAAFSLFIRLHEEPRLRRDFGEEYGAYERQVRRWLTNGNRISNIS